MSVKWTVLHTDEGTLIVLTPDQFERLSYNLSELLRWTQEAMWRLQYYGAP